MNCEYIQKHYAVPACIGRRVIAYGKPGVIAQDRGHHLGILLDSDRPGHILPYHPVDGIEYLDEMGKVRPMTRSQQRYQEYLEVADCYESFHHYLQCKEAERRCGQAGKP